MPAAPKSTADPAPACGVCRHSLAIHDSETHAYCRRYPPVPMKNSSDRLPLVPLTDFYCGEFAAK